MENLSKNMPISTAGPLDGRVVAVTGAASGIGREIVRVFSAAGAKLVALDINEAGLTSLREEFGCQAYYCDVTDTSSVHRAFEEIAENFGKLDVLISNAGSADQGAIGDLSMEALRKSFDLNFFGHQSACQAAIKLFRRGGNGGTILFNISNQSINPGKNFGSYGIPKAATLALMKQYAVDHGHEKIRVNGINAGRVRTGLMTDEMIDERAKARGLSADEYMSGNLLGLEVTATDVANAFLHLAQMDKVNATVITVDGGSIATSLR